MTFTQQELKCFLTLGFTALCLVFALQAEISDVLEENFNGVSKGRI